ncbi:MAG TPA: PHB depolymerase family esterase [Rhizomicrobium sp.]|nr:PHB depolymerase family esterase [Rhizomicrobium sp.]
MKAGLCLLLCLLAVPALAQDTVFTEVTPLSSNTALTRRLLTPLTVAQMQKTLARDRQSLAEQPLIIANEKFLVHLPPDEPASGYGLMVFVPPWRDARLPRGWAGVLDKEGIIFVSALNSGNDQYDMSRRMPLAVAAAHNAMRRYRVDPARVFVAGMSGGSRVAMRLALGYPDLFRGALLNAGSDVPGTREASVPPRDLFQRFQETSRLVYLTGEQDGVNLDADRRSSSAMRSLCTFNTDSIVARGLGHETADPASLSRGLKALQAPVETDPARLQSCRTGIEKEMTAALDRTQALLAEGKRDEARTLLYETDQRFGGLAMPRSTELDAKLEK